MELLSYFFIIKLLAQTNIFYCICLHNLFSVNSFPFLQTMRVCCQDMFFSRSRSTQVGHQLLSIPATREQSRMLGSPLEHMFRKAPKQSQKLNAVKELLDVKIKDPVEQDFSNEVKRNSILLL